MSDFLKPIVKAFSEFLTPLQLSFSSSEKFQLFLLRYGWLAEIADGDMNAINTAFAFEDLITTIIEELDNLINGPTVNQAQAIQSLLGSAQRTVEQIQTLSSTSGAGLVEPLNQESFWNELSTLLLEDLIALYLEDRQPLIFSSLHLLGVIQYERVNPLESNRVPFIRTHLDWEQLGNFLGSPGDALNELYSWNIESAPLQYEKFLRVLERCALAFRLPVAVSAPRAPLAEALLAPDSITTYSLHELELPIVDGISLVDHAYWKIGAILLPIPDPKKIAVTPSGFAVAPVLQGELSTEIYFSQDIFLRLSGAFEADNTLIALVYPNRALLESELDSREIAAAMALIGQPESPWILLGAEDSHRVELGGFKLALALRGRVDDPEIIIEAGTGEGDGETIPKLQFVFQIEESDDFVQGIAGSEAVVVDFSSTVSWSSKYGFAFEGQAGLEIAFAIHLSVGPIDINTLYVALRAGNIGGRVTAEGNFGVGIVGNLGPLTAVVENIGARVSLVPKGDEAGTFGNVDINLGFKPPNGVGLNIDAGVVKGGGYLYFDFDKEEYAGALELVFSNFLTLKAIGLITTRLPDGSKGFSLLIIITAEFGTGLQLGFGFVLLGVGGLLGLNRTMKLEPLAEGVRTGATENVLFPQNVVENAPRIISDLRRFFPPEEGIFLIGPMAKLGWGTPALITLSLGIIFEIPGNIAILGVLKVALPEERAALLILQVNFIGAIEFDKQRAFFFASMFESRILFITIEGEIGVLVAWGSDSNFVVSVGGFHPQFVPPPLPFPSPQRISLNILNESWGRIRIMGYFAVTSNTVQLGARAELFFGFSEFKIEGHLAFDALFQFDPFFFIIEISCGVSLKVFGIGLFSISLKFSLEGPTPWRAKGYGKLKILFFSIKANFDFTWGEKKDTSLPPIEVLPILQAEYEKLSNWTAQLPASSNLLVSLNMPEDGSEELVLHPVGTLSITQRLVPLDLRLDKVGNQRPIDGDRFSLEVTEGLQKLEDLSEQFAIAQFQDFKDAEKLSQAAFQPEDSGLSLAVSDDAFATGKAVKRNIRYETHIIDKQFLFVVIAFFEVVNRIFTHFLNGNAVTKLVISKHYKQQLQPFEDKIVLTPEQFVVASTINNRVASQEMVFTSEAKARECMQKEIAKDATRRDLLHVIPSYEVNTRT